METAQPGLARERRWDTLWICQAGNTLSYDDYCPRVTNRRCQPNNSGKCGPSTPFANDCCAA